MVVAIWGVIHWATAVATMQRSIVPHPMGRILLLGLRRGAIRQEAMALWVMWSTLLVARRVSTEVRASWAWVAVDTTPK